MISKQIIKGWFALRPQANWRTLDLIAETVRKAGGWSFDFVKHNYSDEELFTTINFQIQAPIDIDHEGLINSVFEAIKDDITELIITNVEYHYRMVKEVNNIDEIWQAIEKFRSQTATEPSWRLEAYNTLVVEGAREVSIMRRWG